MMKITGTGYKRCDEEDSYNVNIKATVGDRELFIFHPENGGNSRIWKNRVAACEKEGATYNGGNGDCGIYIGETEVNFELASEGEGGGEVTISVPKKLCLEAFKNIYAITLAE